MGDHTNEICWAYCLLHSTVWIKVLDGTPSVELFTTKLLFKEALLQNLCKKKCDYSNESAQACLLLSRRYLFFFRLLFFLFQF